MFEILSRANAIKDSLNLDSIVVVMDQTIYSKALEICWKHPEMFGNIILHLGNMRVVEPSL